MGFGSKRGARRRSRPGLEALEGRAVPATFHAANAAELVADVSAVSKSSGPNTIVLAPGAYNLTGELRVLNASDLTIQGNPKNPGVVAIIGGFPGRVIEVDGGTLTLSGLTISGGNSVAFGGGIYARNAHLTVQNSTVTDNAAGLIGGGIYAQGGTLTVDHSSVTDNAAGGGALGFGGGIAASGANVTVSASSVDSNTAAGSATDPQAATVDAGGGIYAKGGTLTVSGSRVANNTAFAATSGPSAFSSGGGVATSNTVVTVSQSVVTGNALNAIASRVPTSQGSAFSTVGGSLTITGSTIFDNTPAGKGQFDHPRAAVVLKGSTVDGRKLPGSYTLGDNGFTPNR
jgi:hypothetical protein